MGARIKIVLQLLVQLYTRLTRAISIEAGIKQMVDWRRMPIINTSRSISVSRTTAVSMTLELVFSEGQNWSISRDGRSNIRSTAGMIATKKEASKSCLPPYSFNIDLSMIGSLTAYFLT